jgi:hypothetical protein
MIFEGGSWKDHRDQKSEKETFGVFQQPQIAILSPIRGSCRPLRWAPEDAMPLSSRQAWCSQE